MTFQIHGRHRICSNNLLISCLLINCIVRIWNLQGTVDFGLKRMIFKTLTESFLTVKCGHFKNGMYYQGIQCGKEKEAKLPVAPDIISLFSVPLKIF